MQIRYSLFNSIFLTHLCFRTILNKRNMKLKFSFDHLIRILISSQQQRAYYII